MTDFSNWGVNLDTIPPTLYHCIEELETEREDSGVGTTPDETADVIEALFLLIGRLSLAELWHAVSTERMSITDKEVLTSMLDAKDIQSNPRLTMGRWVGFSRRINHLFQEKKVPMFTDGLLTVDWGQGPNNAVNQLVAFRNRFAHGSFSAPLNIIEHHYQILIDLFTQIKGLYTHLFVASPTVGIQTHTTWHQGRPIICLQTPSTLNDTVWLGKPTDHEDNTWRWMELTPFFTTSSTDTGLDLVLSQFAVLTVEDFFSNERLLAWQAQYDKEYAGDINRIPSIKRRQVPNIPEALKDTVTKTLREHHGDTVQIIGHPGTGLSSILPYFVETTPSFENVLFWNIEEGDITQSGIALLNAIEKILDISHKKSVSLDERIKHFTQSEQSDSLLLVVDGLEYAYQAYRREPYTVLEVLNHLIETNITSVLVSYFSDTRQHIFYDEQIVWNSTTVINPAQLQFEYKRLCQSTLERTILETLQNDTKSLFDLCDALDTKLNTLVFEPEVEYALWKLRPLLRTHISSSTDNQSERNWTIFSTEVLP